MALGQTQATRVKFHPQINLSLYFQQTLFQNFETVSKLKVFTYSIFTKFAGEGPTALSFPWGIIPYPRHPLPPLLLPPKKM